LDLKEFVMETVTSSQFIIPLFLFVLGLNYLSYMMGYTKGLRDRNAHTLKKIDEYAEWVKERTKQLLAEVTADYQALLRGDLSVSEKALKDMELADKYRLEHGLFDKKEKDARLQ
jgi:hypothetical protein